MKHYVGSKVTVQTIITDAGVRTDPSTVTFTYRIGRDGTDNNATVTNTSTGVYEATFTPDIAGKLYGVWETTGTPLDTEPVVMNIHDKYGRKG